MNTSIAFVLLFAALIAVVFFGGRKALDAIFNALSTDKELAIHDGILMARQDEKLRKAEERRIAKQKVTGELIYQSILSARRAGGCDNPEMGLFHSENLNGQYWIKIQGICCGKPSGSIARITFDNRQGPHAITIMFTGHVRRFAANKWANVTTIIRDNNIF